jgi:hypothetical protein
MQEDWTPEEAAALDAAFETGVREAILRGKSLLMQPTNLHPADATSLPVWIAVYPPRHIEVDEVAKWCEHVGFKPTARDLFFPHTHVLRAAHELGIKL